MTALRVKLKPFAVVKTETVKDNDNDQMFIEAPGDLAQVPLTGLVELYNAFSGNPTPLKKFADRATAEKRVWAVVRPTLEKLNGHALPTEVPPPQEDSMATATAKKATTRKAAATAAKPRGLDPESTITKLVEDDGRREGSPGKKSFTLIKDGMTVADFLKKGGRISDLRYDINKKHVKISKA